MIVKQAKRIAALTGVVLPLLSATGVQAAPYTGPIKEIVSSHFGSKVDASTDANICSITSHDMCRPGEESSTAGGFGFPFGVAVAPNGDVYVADTNNDRVQELTASGTFVSMFGSDVDQTTGGGICTAASRDVCKVGVAGGGAGQMSDDYSIAVDRTTGNVYVLDLLNWRVDEYTSAGQFVLTIGKDVNETTGGNLCTAASGDVCKSGVKEVVGGTEAGAFNFAQFYGDLLAVGGPEDTLYVADEHRVQEFAAATGAPKGEIPLTSISAEPESTVVALGVNQTSGNVYLAYRVNEVANIVHEFEGTTQIKEFPIRAPTALGAIVKIEGLAVDASGRYAVLEENSEGFLLFGSLYDGGTGHLITEFTNNAGSPGLSASIAFGDESEQSALYAVSGVNHEIIAYTPVHVAELLARPATCKPGSEIKASLSATFDCTLNGEANPEEVPGTEAWFQLGRGAHLDSETPKQPIGGGAAFVGVSAAAEGLQPDQTYSYRVDGEDENVKSPELLSSETATLKTSTVPPRIAGEPEARFVKAASAVLYAELNPEKAPTRYEFQYGPCENLESCPVRTETNVLQSEIYGETGVALEVKGLQPNTTYHYRLVADNRHTEGTTQEGAQVMGDPAAFTTTPSPSIAATTGPASSITSTSALVTGSVDPGGQPATYEFELGLYEGANTQYGIISNGAVGASTTPIAEAIALTSLQPGTAYSYRISITSSYIQNASHKLLGAPQTFVTAPSPSILNVPASLGMLPMPANVKFPKPAPKCKSGYTLNKNGKCIKTKKKAKQKAKPKKKKKKARKKK